MTSYRFVRILPVDLPREAVAALLKEVDHVHITGGTASAHRILWGDTPEEQRAAIAKGVPRVKEMTAELGVCLYTHAHIHTHTHTHTLSLSLSLSYTHTNMCVCV